MPKEMVMSFKHLHRSALAILLMVALAGCSLIRPTPEPTAVPTPQAAPSATPAFAGPTPLIAYNFEPWSEQLPAMNDLSKLWGPYMAEREWGNPREAVGGDGWGMSYEMAKNVRYEAGEDGIAGWTDLEETICFAFGFWDEKQRYVTERLYGLSNAQGRYGETTLERRTFWENTPTHSYARYEYEYPFDEPNFTIEIIYAKRDNQTTLVQASATATEPGVLHVLPLAWFREGGSAQRLSADAYDLAYNGGHFVLKTATPSASWQIARNATAHKGAFSQAMIRDKQLADSGEGNRAAWDIAWPLQAGESQTLRLAMANAADAEKALHHADAALADSETILSMRRAEADALYRDQVTEHQEVYRYALMNLLWNKMYYQYDGSFESHWMGDVEMHDVVLVPDKWEFPWPAMWDSCFQAKVATLADIDLAKHDLLVFLSDRWQTQTGHVPNVEWSMDGETPPLFAWAAWEIFKADGDRDYLMRILPRLELHYTYANRGLDLDGDQLFTGGFMGMDNVPRPDGMDIEQVDTSAWMALFAKNLSAIAQELSLGDKAAQYEADYKVIAERINNELWNEEDGFYYDRVRSGQLQLKSYAGLIPLIAGVPDADRTQRVLDHLRNPDEFWSDHGIRSVAKDEEIYEPGYSTSGWKNSNWRGPIWLPINYLLVQALSEHDTELAERLRENLVRTVEQQWQVTHRFYEYYHAETGEGLGADHQTGWTALVANLIRERWGE
jgi:hypothetical protein